MLNLAAAENMVSTVASRRRIYFSMITAVHSNEVDSMTHQITDAALISSPQFLARIRR